MEKCINGNKKIRKLTRQQMTNEQNNLKREDEEFKII